MRVLKPISISLVLIILTSTVEAQSLPVDEYKLTKQLPQISLVFNRIFNGSSLDSFYLKLQRLKKTKKGIVTIVHIGDSHLKPDFIPGTIRTGLQDFFGDAGRGFPFSSKLSGMNLEPADSNGVRYQAIGINGARYESYNRATNFWNQLIPLKADLFIIALGTNDAQVNKFNDAVFQKQVTAFIENLKRASPGAAILVTTAPDSFKGGAPNRELWNLNISLLSYCTGNNIPIWDMYRVTNGFGSAHNWLRMRLMSKDGVHFTAAGYKLQGQLLFNALAKGYNNYVSNY